MILEPFADILSDVRRPLAIINPSFNQTKRSAAGSNFPHINTKLLELSGMTPSCGGESSKLVKLIFFPPSPVKEGEPDNGFREKHYFRDALTFANANASGARLCVNTVKSTAPLASGSIREFTSGGVDTIDGKLRNRHNQRRVRRGEVSSWADIRV